MSVEFAELLTRCCLASAERQEKANQVIGGRPSSVDLVRGSIAFDDGPEMAIDLLGTESSEDHSWLWAWANPSLSLPDDRVSASRRIAEFGQRLGVPELAEGRWQLAEMLNLHSLGSVATDLLGADAYFVAATGPFHALLALRSPELALAPLDGNALSRTLLGAIGQYELEHPATIAPYLQQRGAEVQMNSPDWSVMLASGERMTLEFDERGRLSRITRAETGLATGMLEISRVGRAWRDAGRSYEIVIDTVKQGELARGATAELPLPVGRHEVQIVLDNTTSPSLLILVHAGQTVRLRCGPGGSARRALRDSIENPSEYISLEPTGD